MKSKHILVSISSLLLLLGAIPVAYASSDIVSQTPVNGALGVATTSAVTVVFDRNITATTTNISFSPTLAFTFATSSATLTITPSVPFSNNTTYTLTLANIKDVDGNVLSSYTSTFTTKNDFSISIYANTNGGLNLISLPVQPSNTAIASVLGSAASSIDSVWSYDPSNSSAPSSGWLVYYPAHPELSSLSTMNTGYGYWVTANANTTLSGSGSLFASTSTPPSRTVQSGWNLLGYYQLPGQSSSTSTGAFSSISGYTTVIGYDNQTGVFKTVSSILPGDAFWLGTPISGTYYPSYSFSSGNGSAIFEPPQASGTITATKYSGYGNQTMIAGTNNAKLGSFTLSTDSAEGVNVNTITVALSSDEAATITDLKLFVNGVQIGATKVSLSTSNSFSINHPIAASGTGTFDVYGNIKSSANSGTWVANVEASGSGLVTGNAIVSNAIDLQTITLSSPTLSAAVGVSPNNANVIAGSSMVKVGSFDFTSQYSAYTVDKIKVKVPNNVATSITSVTLRYPNTSGVNTDSSAVLASTAATESYATATFTGLTFYIPSNTTKKLDVYVSVSTIQNDGDSGKAISVALDANEGFSATDSSGATKTLLADSDLSSDSTTGKGTMSVRKSIPTLSAVALDTSTLSAGSNKTIARVKITADAAGDISWTKLAFTVNKTASLTLGATSTVKLWQGSNVIVGTFATTTGNFASQSQAFTTDATSGLLVFIPDSEQDVSAGTSLTYELRGTIGGIGVGSNSLDVSISNLSSSVVTGSASEIGITAVADPSFTWSDRSSVSMVHSTTTSDWTNDYLVNTLPLTVGNLSVSI